MAARRRRLDIELVRRGLCATRTEAQEAIRAGRVTVAGAPATSPSRLVSPEEPVVLHGPARRYVSRGGEKLEPALARFGVPVSGRRILDAGASTGGFTDCLLAHGAASVVAVDVGYGQLHPRLRADPRVTVLERTNIRHLTPEELPGGPVQAVVADLSFISLRTVLPNLRALATPDAWAVVLVKPQFEAGPERVSRGGVVRDPQVWAEVLRDVAEAARAVGWYPAGAMPSPLRGPAGNVEFFLDLRADPGSDQPRVLDDAVTEAVRRWSRR